MRSRFLLASFFLFLIFSDSYSQDVPIGSWKDYLSYQQGLTVCQGGNKIYCCASSGVFSYNLGDNSIDRLNKITGLSDINATVARYNSYDNILVVGYSDGNIDIVGNGQIINISDLKNSSVQGSKNINNIYFNNNLAYIACGQGIIEIDLSQDIILGTYYIGTNAAALNVYSLTIFNDTLYAATEKGIYYDYVNDPFINDFQDWKVASGSPLHNGQYNAITTCFGKLYVNYSARLTHSSYLVDTIFEYSAGIWSIYSPYIGATDNIYSLESSVVNGQDFLVFSGYYSVNYFDQAGDRSTIGNSKPQDGFLDNNKNVWAADNLLGLAKYSPDGSQTSFVPPGPASNQAFAIANENGTIWIVPGGYNSSYGPQSIKAIGTSEYSNGTWYRLFDTVAGYDAADLSCVAVDPSNPSHAAVGSWYNGVIEYNNNQCINRFDPGTSTLHYAGEDPGPGYGIRVGGVAFDSNSNLWVTNSLAATDFLSVKKNNGAWQDFDFGGISGIGNEAQITKVIVTQSGAKWMISPGNGILVYNDQGTFAQPTVNNSVLIAAQAGKGHLPSLNIFCLTQDQNGAVWVGTDQQVVVFNSPDNVTDGSNDWDAQWVTVTQTGYTQYLMQEQFTTSIAIDGANRKWIGTLGGGAFLMSSDGTQQIVNFTTSNSPLPSNNILGIAINQVTGEVLFATDKGVVSFKGEATQGNQNFNNVYAYPDPVPHGYSGPIAIKGLVTNSDVKITTVNGELVYHTTALGGQAIWSGLNFDGVRAQTGVYLVFCASPDGSQTITTKLLFIN